MFPGKKGWLSYQTSKQETSRQKVCTGSQWRRRGWHRGRGKLTGHGTMKT
jgi:hypothetical protein